jgi:ketosteroid isomerase-like protein
MRAPLGDPPARAGILLAVTDTEPGLYGTPGRVEREVATVRAIYAAFARRDVEAAIEHVAHDCEFDLPATAARSGRSAPYRGPEGVREYFADAARVWTELTLHADDIRAASGGVVVFGHVEGRLGDELVRRRVLWLWHLRDGKAVRVRANDLGDNEPPG